MANHDVMDWFPRREDYEVTVAQQPDETTKEKVQRLNDNIEIAQNVIKEVVDGDTVSLEHKIYKTMDMHQDIGDFTKLLKQCEEEDKAKSELGDELKKARVGIINLKAYVGQVDVEEFAAAIRNEFQFKVGCDKGFGPWLYWKEQKFAEDSKSEGAKPKSFEDALQCEEKACKFLKEVVRGNKALKMVQTACEGIRGDVSAHDKLSLLQERYFLLCKKAEQRLKNLTHLLHEWKRLEEFLAPTEPTELDDYIPKQMMIFLKTYALYFA